MQGEREQRAYTDAVLSGQHKKTHILALMHSNGFLLGGPVCILLLHGCQIHLNHCCAGHELQFNSNSS